MSQGCYCTEALLNPSSILGGNVGTGIAVALKQAMTPEFRTYQQQVVANCKALSAALTSLGYHVVTGKKIIPSGTISTPCEVYFQVNVLWCLLQSMQGSLG